MSTEAPSRRSCGDVPRRAGTTGRWVPIGGKQHGASRLASSWPKQHSNATYRLSSAHKHRRRTQATHQQYLIYPCCHQAQPTPSLLQDKNCFARYLFFVAFQKCGSRSEFPSAGEAGGGPWGRRTRLRVCSFPMPMPSCKNLRPLLSFPTLELREMGSRRLGTGLRMASRGTALGIAPPRMGGTTSRP